MNEAEVVRRAYEAWNARDGDALAALMTDDAEIHSALASSAGGDGVYHGPAGARDWLRDNSETVGLVMELSQFVVHRGYVLSVVETRIHAAASGVSMPHEYGLVHEVRDGRVARVFTYLDPADAFEAMARLARASRAG
jgi:ketosteroid isomerase-like protein